MGEERRLRVDWGEVPSAGDALVLRSGRRYLVLKVRGKTLHCVVLPYLPVRVEIPGRWLPWMWSPRKR